MLNSPQDWLYELEAAIREGPAVDGFRNARRILRTWLFHQIDLEPEGSVGDAIESLARTKKSLPGAASVVLRCLAVPDLLPTGTPPHFVAELVEKNLQIVIDFFGVDRKAQTFEKMKKFEGVHAWVCAQLGPAAGTYIGIESVLAARKQILAGLNHGVVKSYCDVFKLPEIRNVFEVVLHRIAKVFEQNPTLLTDVDEAREAIEDGWCVGRENGSFLHHQFLGPFLDTTGRALDAFVASIRGKFTTRIVRAGLGGSELQKRYPLHELGRTIEVRIPLRNVGPGLATNVTVSVTGDGESVIVDCHSTALGNIAPGEFSVSLDAVIAEASEQFNGLLLVEWGEIGSPNRQSDAFEFTVLAQKPDINWTQLEYINPYSTDPAKGDDFIGREDLVRRLASKLLRSPMEPFYITGQKRVGKTSLALAAAEFACGNDPTKSLEFKYILWGAIANEDPRVCIKELGLSIESFLLGYLPEGVPYQSSDYAGSLSPLVRLCEFAAKVCPSKKFCIIIDEFDEIHPELFMHGNLAETFFANIRALTATKNFSMVLVGGENMPYIMERQGQKLNRFTRSNLSYFSRDHEWEDYKGMVRAPVEGTISWHEDAISELFNVTNGNPYFTKMLCSAALRAATSERDADITSREVADAVGVEISSLDTNSFAHLWQDGIFKPTAEREPDILRRCRVLVAIARCMRAGRPITVQTIHEYGSSSLSSDHEIQAVLNDFERRGVLTELMTVYSFELPLFGAWLADVGVKSLVSDALAEELSAAVIAEEEDARVRSEEVVALSKKWPTYRGHHISPDEIRAWFEQVRGHKDQRILFKILQATRVLNEPDVRERLKHAHANLRRSLPPLVKKRLTDRRKDILITYIDGEGKSGQYYASNYAEENDISTECIIPPTVFSSVAREFAAKNGQPAAVVVVDDIAATGNSFSRNLEQFVESNREALVVLGAPVVAVALVATEEAVRQIQRRLGEIDQVQVDFRAGELLGPQAFAFHPDAGIWGSSEERERAKALCEDLGAKLVKNAPLGYGGQALLVVFPNTTPNNSLPILHHRSRHGRAKWTPLFPRITN